MRQDYEVVEAGFFYGRYYALKATISLTPQQAKYEVLHGSIKLPSATASNASVPTASADAPAALVETTATETAPAMPNAARDITPIPSKRIRV